MVKKKYIIASLANSFPVYLKVGKAPLFDNFRVASTDLHFSTTITFAKRFDDEIEAEVWIGGILYLFPRFAPLSIVVTYDPEVLAQPGMGNSLNLLT